MRAWYANRRGGGYRQSMSAEYPLPAGDRLVVGPPRLRLLLLVGTCLFAIAILWVPAQYGGSVMRTIGWFGIVLLLPAVLVLLARALRPGPTLVVDEQGITDRTSLAPTGLIRWDEITVVRKREIGRGSTAERMLEIVLVDPEGFCQSRLGDTGWQLQRRWRALLKQPMVAVPGSMVAMPLAQVATEIRKRQPQLEVLEGPPPMPSKFRMLFPARSPRQPPRRGGPDIPGL